MVRSVSYSREAFGNPEFLIENARSTLDAQGVDFDTVIGTGLSGSLVIPTLARAMGKKWAIIRKPNDGSHAKRNFEGEIGDRWLFVDDFIDSGRTLYRVRDGVDEAIAGWNESFPGLRAATQFVGAYLYSSLLYLPAEDSRIGGMCSCGSCTRS